MYTSCFWIQLPLATYRIQFTREFDRFESIVVKSIWFLFIFTDIPDFVQCQTKNRHSSPYTTFIRLNIISLGLFTYAHTHTITLRGIITLSFATRSLNQPSNKLIVPWSFSASLGWFAFFAATSTSTSSASSFDLVWNSRCNVVEVE